MANTTRKKTAAVTVIISGVVLAGLLIVLYFLEPKLSQVFGNLGGKVTIGLMLLLLWVTVGSAVRTVNRHKRSTPFFILLMSGIATAALGSALFTAFLYLFPKINKSHDPFEVAGAGGGLVLFMSGIGLVASLLAIINARVESRFLGNLLEMLVIGACIAGFLYFSTK